jgi:hypothetical protein
MGFRGGDTGSGMVGEKIREEMKKDREGGIGDEIRGVVG